MHTPTRWISSEPIEALESRIAPALLISPTGTSATFTDVDGDLVTVSKGVLDRSDFALTKSGATVRGGQALLGISIGKGSTEFSGADLFITAVPGRNGGDGHVNIRSLFADGIDLGRVNVDGDLGCIVAGDGKGGTPAIAALNVVSFGAANEGTVSSQLHGALGSLKVRGDFVKAELDVQGKIGTVSIRGSLLGGESANSGQIDAKGSIGSIKVGGGIYGGTGFQSGAIHAGKHVASVEVGGEIVAGAGVNSGSISSNSQIGTVAANTSAGTSETLTEANGGLVKVGSGILTLVTGSNTFNGGTDGTTPVTPATPPATTPVTGGVSWSGLGGGIIQIGGSTLPVIPQTSPTSGATLSITSENIYPPVDLSGGVLTTSTAGSASLVKTGGGTLYFGGPYIFPAPTFALEGLVGVVTGSAQVVSKESISRTLG
jgi:hypothetical protein